MSKVLVSESNLTNIANAIRTKNGSSDTYTPTEMDNAINNLPYKCSPDYITNGLIAWFDESEPFDSNERWNSKVGNDYIYVESREYGDRVSNPYFKAKNQPLYNHCDCCFITNNDYLIQGYTIEAVGRIQTKQNGNSMGGHLFQFNLGYSPIIGFRQISSLSTTQSYVNFINGPTNDDTDNDLLADVGKDFGASLVLYDIGARNVSKQYTVKGSLNGSAKKTYTQTTSATHNSKGNNCNTLCYYTSNNGANTTYRANGGVRCIRIYNRELTDEEIAHNHAIDVARFNLSA